MNLNARTDDATFLKSTFHEQLVQHVFISEILQEVWYSFRKTVEVLRSEIDASGYDVVLECNGVVRHVQLKTSQNGAKTARQKVNLGLEDKPSGCVVWIIRHQDGKSPRMKLEYLFFGSRPKEPLSLQDCKTATHTKGNAQGVKLKRPRIRLVPKKRFDKITSTRMLAERLFGLAESNEAQL